jgi:hypothetical protein
MVVKPIILRTSRAERVDTGERNWWMIEYRCDVICGTNIVSTQLLHRTSRTYA